MQSNNHSTTDVYQRITDYVIDALQKGQVPWQKQWTTAGLPRNIISNRQYRGWNVFLLNYVTIYKRYDAPYFLTFKQAQAAGGNIRRGEKGYPIIYWAVVETNTPKKKKDEEMDLDSRTRLVPKLHVVFNIQQTEGISLVLPQHRQKNEHEKIAACDVLIDNMPKRPLIRHGGDAAYYNKLVDEIQLPNFSSFHSAEDYYKTCFHELAHSTGHSSRLNRKELMEAGPFSDQYSKEELTAEMTAAYLSAVAGIEQKIINNSTAYIQGWLKKLRNDKTLLLKAATQAQAAADFILNTTDNSLQDLQGSASEKTT